MKSTSEKVVSEPGSASSFSISITSPCAARYCLPPVLKIAYAIKFSLRKRGERVPRPSGTDKVNFHQFYGEGKRNPGEHGFVEAAAAEMGSTRSMGRIGAAST